jgi:hypothetical protein
MIELTSPRAAVDFICITPTTDDMSKAKKDFRSQAQGLGGLNSVLANTSRAPQPEALPEDPETLPEPEVGEEVPAKEGKVIKARRPKGKVRGDKFYREVEKPKYIQEEEENRPKSERGCKEGETRKTFIITKETSEKLQDIAYWEPGKLKDHVNAALAEYAKKKWTKARPKGS